MKYTEWLNIWLENYIKPSVKVRTYERYSLIVSSHIGKTFGDIELNDLTPVMLQQFVTRIMQNGNSKTGEGLSANTVNTIISVLQNSLRTAY